MGSPNWRADDEERQRKYPTIKLDENIIGISKWCVKCYIGKGKKVGAVFTYNGDSVCEECLRI
jgi:hypothetical protein